MGRRHFHIVSESVLTHVSDSPAHVSEQSRFQRPLGFAHVEHGLREQNLQRHEAAVQELGRSRQHRLNQIKQNEDHHYESHEQRLNFLRNTGQGWIKNQTKTDVLTGRYTGSAASQEARVKEGQLARSAAAKAERVYQKMQPLPYNIITWAEQTPSPAQTPRGAAAAPAPGNASHE